MTELSRYIASKKKLPPPAEQPKPRKPMRRVSKERAKLMREVGPERKAYIQEIGYCEPCWVIDRRFVNTDLVVHEIAKGPARKAALSERAAQLVACTKCNCGRLEDYNECPLTLQLAVKLLDDTEHFDLEKVNELRGRAPTAITFRDVLAHFKFMPPQIRPTP